MRDNPKLYEINTAVWLYELSLKYGCSLTIGKVPLGEWDMLKDSGFDYVWLMGIWKRSKIGFDLYRLGPEFPSFQSNLDMVLPGWTNEDIIYSPYSISSYDPDPFIGNWDDIDSVKEELHKRNMGLILDFVPNHTAPDHPWVYEHPDYYIQGSEKDFAENPLFFTQKKLDRKTLYLARGKDPYFSPWTDTVQLNHFNPAMRSALLAELQKIAGHCDGVRCDMAMLVLNDIFDGNWKWAKKDTHTGNIEIEYWEDVRRALPDLLLIAEAYWDTESRLQQLGFDYAYDKGLYDRLLHSSPTEVKQHLKADTSYQQRLVRFIENHDEPRSADVFDIYKLKASAVLYSTLPGMKLYHQGQIEGKRIKIPVQIRLVREEIPDEGIKRFYEKLLSIAGDDIFYHGDWNLLDVLSAGDESYHSLISYIWRWRDKVKIIAVNLSKDYSQGMIVLYNQLTASGDFSFHDEWSGQSYLRPGNEVVKRGLHVILPGFHAHIFNVSKQ